MQGPLWRRMSRPIQDWVLKPISRHLVLILSSLALCLVLATFVVIPPVLAVYRPQSDKLPAQSDAVIVFGGEKARVRLALELVESGLADTLVVSFGKDYSAVATLCGQLTPVVVLCPEPSESNTKGEAQMFGALAERYGWAEIVAVTGDYHGARARLWADRCIDADVTFALVDWPRPRLSVATHEIKGLIADRWLHRGC